MAEFSKQLERLEAIVRRLEAEDLDLDEALKLFEEGVERLRVAREQLTQAELTVKKGLAIENPRSISRGRTAAAPARALARAVSRGGRRWHDRRPGARSRSRSEGAADRCPGGGARSKDRCADRRVLRDRRTLRGGNDQSCRSAARLWRGDRARLSDCRRRA